MSENQIMVRWYPPYSNGCKEQPVNFLEEAEIMVNWFRSINVRAEIVRVISIKEQIEY